MNENGYHTSLSFALRGMDDWLALECEALKIPGASVTIFHQGSFSSGCSGYFSLTGREPITVDTLFPLGCISKLLTAIVLLRLCDQGLLDLGDSIVNGLDLNQGAQKRISPDTKIGHLLSHTSGIVSDLEVREKADDLGVSEPVQLSLQQSFLPGSIFSYAHTPHVLAGAIVEEVTGLSWAENVEKLLVDGLNGIFSVDPNVSIPSPHLWRGPQSPAEPWYGRYPTAQDPAIQATTGNYSFTDTKTLARLGRALLMRSGSPGAEGILSDRAKDLLRTANWRPLWGGSPFCGVGLKTFANGCYGHRSSSGGYNSLFLIYPERALAMSVAANVNTGVLAQKLMIAATSKDYDLTVSMPDGELPIRGPRAFLGQYANCGQVVEIGEVGGYLTFFVVGSGSTREEEQGRASQSVRLINMAANLYIGPSPFATLPGGKNGAMIEFIDDGRSERFQWIRINEVAYQRIEHSQKIIP